MDDFLMNFVAVANNDKDALAKAIAHFMFRELVEDIHADNRITDQEMKDLNREACNRASLLINHILNDDYISTAFKLESVMCSDWDSPVMTDELNQRLQLYSDIASDLKKQ